MGINELQQDLPCQEAVWEAPNARTWKRLYLQYRGKSYPPTFHAALQDLRLGKPISNATGNFGKLVLAYAVYLTAWELQSRDSNPLLGPASEIACWKMVASSVLEALQPDLTSKSDSSGMDLMLQGFIDNVHLILHAPLADLLDLARSQINNRKNAAEVRQRLLHWIQEDDGRTARRAVLHASVLFSLVRRKSCHGFHEPFALLFSTLTIWAFIHLNSTLSSLNSSTDGERQQTIRLDKIRDERGIHDWVEYGSRLRGHLTDVGNICGPGAGQRLLQVSCQSLLSMEVWTLSKGFANVLSSLKGRRVD
jgi:hypothetical protein